MIEDSLSTTILVIDDEESFCILVKEILKSKGYDVIFAHSVADAELIIEDGKVDLIIQDIVMPGESGMKFLERFKTNKNKIPMIMVTGDPQMSNAVESFKFGAIDYLSKPITPEQLLSTTRKALEIMAAKRTDRTVVLSDSARYISGYRVKRILGEGSMGMVYLVEGKANNGKTQAYAMKVLKPLTADEPGKLEHLKKRFMVEARAAFSIQHPNIVQVHDYGTCENLMPYILMEYCEGKSLDTLIAENVLTLKEKCHILRQLASALAAIHESEICHRDIKPGNVIIQDDMTARLTDFGIARLRDSNLTMTSEVFGTPAYLSPEAFESAKVNYRADIFSFGAMAYEMFTGGRPFIGPSIAIIARKITKDEPIWPRKKDPNFPKPLEDMLRKALRKDPVNRFDSAFEMYLILNDFLEGTDDGRHMEKVPGFFDRLMGRK
ncbi:hypothetical protein BVX99_03520 [bacterium F16]|nr:hypothetical protein BVX99_03520 [bacterium F16]